MSIEEILAGIKNVGDIAQSIRKLPVIRFS